MLDHDDIQNPDSPSQELAENKARNYTGKYTEKYTRVYTTASEFV